MFRIDTFNPKSTLKQQIFVEIKCIYSLFVKVL